MDKRICTRKINYVIISEKSRILFTIKRGVIPIKKIVIALAVIIILLGAWLTYTKRGEETTNFKSFQPNQMEEALAKLDFTVGVPSYIPEGYSFGGATVFQTEEVSAISLNYQATEDDVYEIAASYLEESTEDKVKELTEFTWEETNVADYQAFQSASADEKEKRVIFKTEENIFYSLYANSKKKNEQMLSFDEIKEILASIE